MVADLTIKGITKSVSFDMTVNGNTATTKFMVDRTQYDIKYNSASIFSSIGDKAIVVTLPQLPQLPLPVQCHVQERRTPLPAPQIRPWRELHSSRGHPGRS